MRRSRSKLREIAYTRIVLLFHMATSRLREGDLDLARRYVEIALRIASKAGIRLPKKYKRCYCRKCFVPLIPGVTLSVRIRNIGRDTRITYRCLVCGWKRRFLVKKQKRR